MIDKKKEACNALVKALVGDKLAMSWWSTPNKAFKEQTPFVAYQFDPDVVYDYLIWHAYCVGG